MEQKKEWEKPQLIILGKGKPEECVLATCKTSATCTRRGNSGNVPTLKLGAS
jgi:hypothetical protein